MKKYEAIGVVETQYFTKALTFLDDMLKVADIEFLNSENYLGGRLITLIVGGSVSSIQVAIDIVRQRAAYDQENSLKMSLVITNPHEEMMKYIIPRKVQKEAIKKEISSKAKVKTAKTKK